MHTGHIGAPAHYLRGDWIAAAFCGEPAVLRDQRWHHVDETHRELLCIAVEVAPPSDSSRDRSQIVKEAIVRSSRVDDRR